MAKVLRESDGLISFGIRINGKTLKDSIEVVDITVQREVNRIATATITVLDGSATGTVNEAFDNSEGKEFVPGNEIEISLGYKNKNDIVFKGLIISQRLTAKRGKSFLSISCKDMAVKMTKGRYNKVFQDQKDSDAIQGIVGQHGLKLTLDNTLPVLPVLVQYNCSDWDFMLIRAEMNDMTVITQNNELIIKKTDFGKAPQYKIDASQDAIDIDLSLDGEHLSNAYELTAWDDKEQKENEVLVKLSDGLGQGNLSAKKLAQLVDNGDHNHFSSATLSIAEMKLWGTTLANKAVLSKIQGNIVVPGTSELGAGDFVEISGFSKRFNGKGYISGVSHEVSDGNWITHLQLGMAPKWQAASADVQDMAASGLIPATDGFQVGKVQKIDQDPQGDYRVLVKLSSFTGTKSAITVWARLSFPYATKGAGFFFFPEKGDEVLVTFINNDPRFAVITGALYSAKNKPKEVPDAQNRYKSFRSRSGIHIKFDDDDKTLELKTPGGNSITMDDNGTTIIEDQSGNTVVMDNSGIVLDSNKDIKLSAKDNIEIKAGSKLSLKGNTDVKIDGTNINLKAQMGLTAKGNTSAEISASGQTTVKGAMVMIN